jgi:hypothetical protein
LLLLPVCTIFTIIYLKQIMFILYTVLQLFCIYNLCYIKCYFPRAICSVPLHQHFPHFVCSAQYGWFELFLSFVLSRYVVEVMSE